MLKILRNISLKPYNTFGIDAKARLFCEIQKLEEIKELITHPEFDQERLWISGGSNMLLRGDFKGLVIKISIRGKEIVEQEEKRSLVSAFAGENWHEFVQWTIEKGLGGLENLSLIPGNVGTAPIQNIGAYGVELKDCFHHLEALEVSTGDIHTFNRKECRFGYRDSIFKNSHKKNFIITKVFLKLTNEGYHQLNTSYGAIEKELEQMGEQPSIGSISRAVINIRQSKLPDPKKVGNSGSFFKNPVVDKSQYDRLQKKFPDIVGFYVSDKEIKLAAGWMIEKCGWKGYRKGDAGVHERQALVLVNYGNASGKEIEALSEEIRASVFRTFGVELEAEVNIV